MSGAKRPAHTTAANRSAARGALPRRPAGGEPPRSPSQAARPQIPSVGRRVVERKGEQRVETGRRHEAADGARDGAGEWAGAARPHAAAAASAGARKPAQRRTRSAAARAAPRRRRAPRSRIAAKIGAAGSTVTFTPTAAAVNSPAAARRACPATLAGEEQEGAEGQRHRRHLGNGQPAQRHQIHLDGQHGEDEQQGLGTRHAARDGPEREQERAPAHRANEARRPEARRRAAVKTA